MQNNVILALIVMIGVVGIAITWSLEKLDKTLKQIEYNLRK